MNKFLIIGSVWITIVTVVSSVPVPNIPGLDHLISGFDASKMKSISELEVVSQDDKIKAAIFDLSELGQPYVLKTNGHTQVFQTPLAVQVTDVSRRRENYCETIASSFEEFYHSYFQSTSFSVGIKVSNFEASIGYNKILERAYNSTKDKQQSIGISGRWWGMYSMQLPPAFLLPFSRYFNQSIQRLQQIGIPTSEGQQTTYNSVVRAYGTHYISSVIVGGTAFMYTFVNTSYSSSQSYEKVSEQISLTFQYKQYALSGNHTTGSISERLSKEFLKNSNDMTEFYPPVQPEQGKSEWEAWLNQAWQQPVAVNRTVSPIIDLVVDYPDVQTHLQKTIDYCIQFNKYPTLQQLQ
ncbi:unnamed protein product [Rotaria sordida]|uniref:MACPF domain-containing protein n=2 Tax=Rotaria sordida TaxID=392033 RepID=A0A814ZKQ6_9BILA|nr:unnamed protein product [Rotaria sordida]